MTDIWATTAWVIPVFAGAAGALLFGYLRFLRWSQAEEPHAADRDGANGTVARFPIRPTRGEACAAAEVAGRRVA